LIPGLYDSEIEAILEAARAAGATSAGYIPLRLPHEIKDLVREWLETHYPNRARRVLALVRDIRGGKLNDARFGSRMKGQGPVAELLARRFALAAKRLGFANERADLDTTQFAPPPQAGDQMRLL
jgi:DNA repair photolyase